MKSIDRCILLLTFLKLLAVNGEGDDDLIFRQPGEDGYYKREHSLIRPFQGVGADSWDFSGSTMVTGTHIRLTPDRQSKVGAMWNRIPCMLRNWELYVHFEVHGSGVDLYGDGFALWLTKERNERGSVFGNKDLFTGLAIFFDTYSNHNGEHAHVHPYVSAVVNNGTLAYDHDYDGTHTQIAGCSASFRGRQHDTFASLRYVKNKLTLQLDIDGTGDWRTCFEVDGVYLPLGYYFGASAATGDLADNHDISTFKVFEIQVKDDNKVSDTDLLNMLPYAKSAESPRERVEDKGSLLPRRKSLSIVFIFIPILAISGIVVYFLVKRQSTKAKKRFY